MSERVEFYDIPKKFIEPIATLIGERYDYDTSELRARLTAMLYGPMSARYRVALMGEDDEQDLGFIVFDMLGAALDLVDSKRKHTLDLGRLETMRLRREADRLRTKLLISEMQHSEDAA